MNKFKVKLNDHKDQTPVKINQIEGPKIKRMKQEEVIQQNRITGKENRKGHGGEGGRGRVNRKKPADS